ncbi:MOSC domain-containing protein YiiM [Streptacidiphilus sp. MAP12-16]|uniref:MOSC domain-containing protein n=1 Tax=Streptacidiphilus sp. MAP12-16 TaxID=3156300 RepID=UPI003518AC2C
MGKLLSVNVGRGHQADYTDQDRTGIDKRPVDGPVALTAPGPRGVAASGVAGDTVCDLRYHGGDDQAVYAYSREELDSWEQELGRELSGGVFGENLTTRGIAVSDAVIGERWQVGERVVLEVSATRIPCRTFAGWLDQRQWVKRFTQRALPGAYLRVLTPGEVRAGDPVTVLSRPDHGLTTGMVFRALTLEPELLPQLVEVDALAAHQREAAAQRLRARQRN